MVADRARGHPSLGGDDPRRLAAQEVADQLEVGVRDPVEPGGPHHVGESLEGSAVRTRGPQFQPVDRHDLLGRRQAPQGPLERLVPGVGDEGLGDVTRTPRRVVPTQRDPRRGDDDLGRIDVVVPTAVPDGLADEPAENALDHDPPGQFVVAGQRHQVRPAPRRRRPGQRRGGHRWHRRAAGGRRDRGGPRPADRSPNQLWSRPRCRRR